MHFLDRSRVAAPECLVARKGGRDPWDGVEAREKEEIHASLARLTESRCAYCESDLKTSRKHIEHFRTRHRFPTKTFDWNNLFISCTHDDSCGRHKDSSRETKRAPYEPTDLIKPDEEDPERFFLFYPDGTIALRDGLNEKERFRARETLRVFNLQNARLAELRRLAVRFYRSVNPDLLEFLEECSVAEREEFLVGEVRATSAEPFATTVKHFLQLTPGATVEITASGLNTPGCK